MSKPLKVLGRATSSNVQIVMWAINELELPHKRVDTGGAFGGNDTPEYLSLNPNSKVPVLIDGDLVLFESAAILRYLAARYGDETFWPKNLAKRAELDVWAEWTKTTLYPILTTSVFWTLVRTPKADRNREKHAANVVTLGKLMRMADKRLGNGPYLGGDDLTFADIVLGHTLYRYHTLDIDRPDTPAVARYYDHLKQRQDYADHVMVDYSSLQVE